MNVNGDLFGRTVFPSRIRLKKRQRRPKWASGSGNLYLPVSEGLAEPKSEQMPYMVRTEGETPTNPQEMIAYNEGKGLYPSCSQQSTCLAQSGTMGNASSSPSPSKGGSYRTSLSGPIQITFGVELEFIVEFSRVDYVPLETPEPEGQSSRLPRRRGLTYLQPLRIAIAEALEKRGVPVYDPRESEKFGMYDCWTVTTDATIKCPISGLNEDRRYIPIEVKTRILRMDDKGITELRRGIVAITENFKTGVNESCGLHVHVGNDGKKGFPLTTLKTLAGLIVGFEPHANSLHPARRCQPDSWCAPLSNLGGFEPLSPLQRVLAVERTGSLRSFLELTGDPLAVEPMAVNFGNLTSASRKQTVEFRQHEGTMEEERVVMWVRLVTRLVKVAHEMLSTVYVDIVREKVDVGGFGVLELLGWMMLDDVALYYSDKLHEHQWAKLPDGSGGGR